MSWTVDIHPDFLKELQAVPREVIIKIAQLTESLEVLGPTLSRPLADTLHGSKFKNMKELRFEAADGVWRVAFAFDPERQAILLAGGDKSGVSQARFYKRLIEKADARFEDHLKERIHR